VYHSALFLSRRGLTNHTGAAGLQHPLKKLHHCCYLNLFVLIGSAAPVFFRARRQKTLSGMRRTERLLVFGNVPATTLMAKPNLKMTLCRIMDVSADCKVVHDKSFVLVSQYPTWQPANEHSKERVKWRCELQTPLK